MEQSYHSTTLQKKGMKASYGVAALVVVVVGVGIRFVANLPETFAVALLVNGYGAKVRYFM